MRWRVRENEPSSQSGFTLVELLVVLAILGLLVAVATPQVLKYLGKAKNDTARIEMKSMATALDLFLLDVGRYPSTAEGLTALVRPTAGLAAWNGPYLKGNIVPNDPWNNPYVYRAPAEHGAYDIVSYGSDGQEGGSGVAADISLDTMTSAKNE